MRADRRFRPSGAVPVRVSFERPEHVVVVVEPQVERGVDRFVQAVVRLCFRDVDDRPGDGRDRNALGLIDLEGQQQALVHLDPVPILGASQPRHMHRSVVDAQNPQDPGRGSVTQDASGRLRRRQKRLT
jgi:hypothetical protein